MDFVGIIGIQDHIPKRHTMAVEDLLRNEVKVWFITR